jgi:PAS domain S-box-containing protein
MDVPSSLGGGPPVGRAEPPMAVPGDDVHRRRLALTVLLAAATILSVCAVVFGVGVLLGFYQADMPIAAAALAAVSATAWLILRGSPRWRVASVLLPSALLALAFYGTWRYGQTTLTLLQYAAALIVGAVLLSRRGLLVLLGGCLVGVNAQALSLWMRGVQAEACWGALSEAVVFSLFLVLCGGVLRKFVGEFESALGEARAQAAALLESEERYRRLSESLSDFAYAGRFDRQRGFVHEWASGALPRTLGIAGGALRDLDGFLAIMHPDDRAPFGEMLERVRAGEACVSEFRIIGRDGAVVWVRDFASPVRNAEGRVVGACGAVQNITERKRAEEALRAILESTLAASPERVFESIAESVCHWLGADAVLVAELVAGGWVQALSFRVDGRAVGLQALPLAGTVWEALAREGFLSVAEGVALHFPGDTELARLGAVGFAGAALRNSLGQAIGVLGVISRRPLDLPSPAEEGLGVIATIAAAELERRVAEQARRVAEERLRQAEKMEAIGRLAGGVAHDFNNQLVGIMGYAELLLGRLEGEAIRRSVERILTASRRAADLTRQLLTFARRGQYAFVTVDVNVVIREVIGLLERSIDKRIGVCEALRAQRSATLGDASQLQSALLNVALNARDAMPEGGVLTFATENVVLDGADCQARGPDAAPGRYVCVAITDTGVGMDGEMLKRLFEPFFTTKEPGKGTGMGLAAVYGTVKAHGGFAEVASQVGAGTTFSLYLPEAEAATESRPADVVVEPAATSARLLVADDEEIVRSMMTEALTDLGYRVTACADGDEALETYRARWREIDLVVLDLVMPKMGGHEVFLAMQRCNPDLRVLLCSGYSLSDAARKLLAQPGIVGFLQKPFEVADLSRAVAEGLARR